MLRRPLQSALLILGVALGVGVIVAIDLASKNATEAFDLSTEAIVGRATHQVRGGPSGLPEALYRRLRSELGYRRSAPIVDGYGLAIDLDSQPVRVLGVDPFAEGSFRDFLSAIVQLQEVMAPFYTSPGTVILDREFADELNLGPGDRLRLQVGDRIKTVTVHAVLGAGSGGRGTGLGSVLLMDLAGAQELLGSVGRLTRVDLILEPGQAAELEATLPPEAALVSASEQRGTADQLTAAFRLNLSALSLLALVLGMFLVYNTMTFAVLQRRRILGILRAVGVPGWRLFVQLLLEAALLSALGSVLGLGLGWLLAQGAIGLVARSINDLYFPLSISRVDIDPLVLLKAAALGLLAGVGAAMVPAAEAAQVPPVSALQRSDVEISAQRRMPRVAQAGLILLALGAALLFGLPDSLSASFAGIFSVLIGVALISPVATCLFMQLVSRYLPRLAGIAGRLAPRTVMQAISRTGVAIAALMLALAVAIGVGLMISSFRTTVNEWLDLTLRADIYISPPWAAAGQTGLTIKPSLAQELAQVQGVRTVELFRAAVVESDFGPINLTVVDAERERDAGLYRFTRGSPEEAWRLVRSGAVMASETLLHQLEIRDLPQGITLRTENGPRTFPLAAVYYDYSSDRGSVMMGRDTYLANWNDPNLTSLAIFAVEEFEAADLAAALRRELAGTGLLVQVNQELREQALTIFDQTFAITAALRLLAVVVAFIGVLSALLSLQLERGREMATLRALGLTQTGLQGVTFLETGIMGLTAGLWAQPTGLMLALVLIYIINLRSFGWTIQLALHASPFLQAMLIGILAALTAAVIPAVRLRTIPVATALRQE